MENVIACLLLILTLKPALTCDLANMRQPCPIAAGRDMRKIIRNGIRSTLIATMGRTFCCMCRVGEGIIRIVWRLKRLDNCRVELFLVSLHRNGISGLFRDNIFRNFLLTSHRIDGDNTSLKHKQLEQFWYCRDFIRLFCDFYFCEYQMLRM